jgi:4-hydroxybenzoate polyprenyltransferase
LSKIISFFFAGNFFISICAALLCMQTFVILQKDIDLSLIAFVFFACLTVYNLHSIVGHLKSPGHHRYKFLGEHLFYFLAITSVSAITSTLVFCTMYSRIYLPFICVSIPTLLYVLPLFGGKRLRDFPLLKMLILVLVWPMVTVMLPYAYIGQAFDSKFVLLMSERSIFVFSIALAFDIRDIEYDRLLKTKTIPMFIGRENSFWLAAFALLCWMLTLFIIYPIMLTMLLGIVALLTILLIRGALKNQQVLYYQFFLDGMLALQAILVLIFYK